ncbi:MAG: GHKL domain-containing protein [Oscillospiraceae bacterium]|nr:GHKL domain-containing protein [Oscillospiraceae bacterium]
MNKKVTIRNAMSVLLLILLLLLLFSAYQRNYVLKDKDSGVTELKTARLEAGDSIRTITLPCTLSGYEPGTELRVCFSCEAGLYDSVFFGAVYTPLSVFCNGEKVFSCGEKGTYPDILRDPPTQYRSVQLQEGAAAMPLELEFVYRMPVCRSFLTLHAPLVGSEIQILQCLFARHGISMLLSLFFLAVGPVLLLFSLFFRHLPVQRRAMMLSGFLLLFAGAWQFGENTLSNYLIKAPALLYVMDFAGMFLVVIPIADLAGLTPELEKSRSLYWLDMLLRIAAVAALLFQLCGIVPLHRSLFVFQALLPISILLLTIRVVWEFLRNKSRTAGLFCAPLLVLLISAFLELANYRLRFVGQFSSIFQTGLFAFALMIGAYSVLSVREIFLKQLKMAAMENELKMQDQAVEAQQRRNELLLSHYEEIRQQRHDMRHHLRTLDTLLSQGDYERTRLYLQSAADLIPDYQPEILCDNVFVNSTLCFYLQRAREAVIQISIDVQVPSENPNISDASLCVVFGNLLENAIEASGRLPATERSIVLSARVIGDMLFISLDNAFDGQFKKKDGDYLSGKHAGTGTGLVSVRSIAERHSGSASFEAGESVFRSEVSVRL